MMRWREIAAIGSFAAATGLSASGAFAASVAVDIDIAPPPPRYEVVPPPRVGYVWTPGYWRWDAPHHHHVWINGRYVHERHGEHWVAHRWSEHDGRWRFNDGHWERG